MGTVHLVYLAAPRTGGWVSYTAHLAAGLRQAGHWPAIRKLGKRTERTPRPFGMGLQYINTSLPMLRALAVHGERVLIVAAEAKQAPAVADLRTLGAGLVVHDPNELKGDAFAAATTRRDRLFVVRPAMRDRVPGSVFVPHPYQRASIQPGARPVHAVAYSRLDWDKHTDIIAAANASLPPPLRVQVHGTENRMYTHHKLDSQWPAWRDDYHGAMPRDTVHAGARLAAAAWYAVDLSVIKGDGGGTQYTFLEALDGGAALVISDKWLTGDPAADTIEPYAVPVGSPAALRAVLDGPPIAPADTSGIWAAHAPASVASVMMEAWQ
jgi:hypothetical protein